MNTEVRVPAWSLLCLWESEKVHQGFQLQALRAVIHSAAVTMEQRLLHPWSSFERENTVALQNEHNEIFMMNAFEWNFVNKILFFNDKGTETRQFSILPTI